MSKAIIICGDRHWKDVGIIDEYIRSLHSDTRVITGGGTGADTIAENARIKYGLDGEVYDANWTIFGRAAGPIRNRRMIINEFPYLIVGFHDNISRSRGTRDTLLRAKRRGIQYQIRKSDGSVEYEPKL